MVVEMIRFMKKWGMWRLTRIFACGNAYDADDDHEGGEFNGLSGVIVQKDVDPDDYVEAPFGEDEDFKHIFDMTFEGPLYEIFADGMLLTEYGQIGPEGWDHILENGDHLESVLEKIEGDPDVILSEIISEGGEDSVYSMWDPLKFEDFNEYRESDEYDRYNESKWKDGSELIPAYTIFDNYEQYLAFLNGQFRGTIQNNPLLKKMAAAYIKKIASDELEYDEIILTGDVVDQIKTEFRAIFEKYGLDYSLIYNWMLAGYEAEKDDPERDEKIRDQKREAAERLRFLGVSEKDIRAFEEQGMIPAVVQLPDGTVKREMRSADMNRSIMKKAFRGNLPYLTFVSKGFIPMDAYLYVEENSDEREMYRREMVQGSRKQFMSAVVFSDFGQDWEYGSIEIELTEDGPLRTG